MTPEEIREQLPKELIPKHEKDSVTVPVEITGAREFSPEQVQQLQEKLGLVGVNSKRLMALPEIARLAKEMGVVETINATTLVGQDTIVACLVKCGNIISDETGKVKEKNKQEAMRLVGYLTGALSKLNMTVVKVGATVAEVRMEADKQHRNTFKAGMAVRPAKSKA